MLSSTPMKVLLSVILTIVIVGLLSFGFLKNNQLNDTKTELVAAQNELTTTQANLANTQASLANTETQLSQKQADLATSLARLAVTRNELETTSQALDDKSSQLAQAQADYKTSLKALDTEKALTAELQSNFANLQSSYASLTTGYGYVMKDPTYQEAKAFIAADTTNTNPYVNDSYVCEDFSADVILHAMQQKFRCAFVSIRFINSAHAIVAFNTTDRGILYIEPQSDEEVNLQTGKHYWTQCVITTVHYTTTYDDTIYRFNVIW